MKCKALVLTHGDLAEAFIRTIQMIVGDAALIQYKNFPSSFNIERYKDEIEEILQENLDTGVLVITDLLGGSPFISSSQVIQKYWDKMELVTGCNLPMLLAVADAVEEKNIVELKEIAIEAGRSGVTDLKRRLKEV